MEYVLRAARINNLGAQNLCSPKFVHASKNLSQCTQKKFNKISLLKFKHCYIDIKRCLIL